MSWSGITSVTTYSAGNNQTISVPAGEMLRVRTIRPTTGPDGSVVIYDQTGAPIKTITVAAANPDCTVEFATTATSISYSTNVAFDSPGLSIIFDALTTSSASTSSDGTTQFPGAVIVPKLASGVRCHKTYHGDASGGSFAVSTSTGMEQKQALADFYGFRVYVLNWDTSSKTLGQSIYTLPTTRSHNGQGATWANLYSGGTLTSLTVPASSQADAGSVLSTIPGILAMDPIYKKNNARSDGGIGPLLSVRTWWPSGSRPGLAGNGVYATQLGLTGVDEVAGNSAGNDRVTTNPQDYGMTMSNANAAYQWTFVEFYYYAKSIALASFGDSTMNAYGSTSGFTSAMDMAAKYRRDNANLSTIISPAKFGGKTALGTLATLKATITAGITIDYALIPTWTINDGRTDAAFDLGMGCAIEMIQRCKAANITPILLTPRLNNGLAGAEITRWQEQKAKVLAMSGQVLVCDWTKNAEDPAAPSHFLASLTTDGTHQNDAGYAVDGRTLLDTLVGYGLVK